MGEKNDFFFHLAVLSPKILVFPNTLKLQYRSSFQTQDFSGILIFFPVPLYLMVHIRYNGGSVWGYSEVRGAVDASPHKNPQALVPSFKRMLKFHKEWTKGI